MGTLGFEPGTSGSLVMHSTTVPQQLLVLTSDNLSIQLWCRGIGSGIVLIGPVRDFSFWPHQRFNWGPLDL